MRVTFITFRPAAATAQPVPTRSGDTLIVGGRAFDLAGLTEGQRLPAGAFTPPLVATARREAGELTIGLLWPLTTPDEAAPADLDEVPDDPYPENAAAGTVDLAMAEPINPATALPDLQPYQFFAMLELSGKRAAVDAFLEALPEPQRTIGKAKLEHTTIFHRHDELVDGAQQAIGLTAEELDGLWLQAAGIS